MQQISIEKFSDIVSHMSIAHSHDSGFCVTHFGLTEAGEKAVAVSHMDGSCYLMTCPA